MKPGAFVLTVKWSSLRTANTVIFATNALQILTIIALGLTTASAEGITSTL